jgi:hypothetical protein
VHHILSPFPRTHYYAVSVYLDDGMLVPPVIALSASLFEVLQMNLVASICWVYVFPYLDDFRFFEFASVIVAIKLALGTRVRGPQELDCSTGSATRWTLPLTL